MSDKLYDWNIDRLSACSIPIVGWSGDNEVGIATGFYWRCDDRIFLVSNWHVMSGRKPMDGQPVQANSGLIPNRIETVVRMIDPTMTSRILSHKMSIRLWKASKLDGAIVANWLQHPRHGQDVDVAAIDVSGRLKRISRKYVYCVNDIASMADMNPQVGSDVFVIGFPLRPEISGSLPVWKRGSIATEPSVAYRGKQAFLVDSTTKDGMSGSPVIFHSNSYRDAVGASVLSLSKQSQFLGVYSGRELGTNSTDTQLGVVWKKGYVRDVCIDGIGGLDRNFGVSGIELGT